MLSIVLIWKWNDVLFFLNELRFLDNNTTAALSIRLLDKLFSGLPPNKFQSVWSNLDVLSSNRFVGLGDAKSECFDFVPCISSDTLQSAKKKKKLQLDYETAD